MRLFARLEGGNVIQPERSDVGWALAQRDLSEGCFCWAKAQPTIVR